MSPLQITFIVVTPIIVILIVLLFCYKPIKKAIDHRHFKNAYYKKIYKTTLYGDYFLINDFLFFHEDNKTSTVDHLMLGEKFIYVIMDYCFKGSLKGSGDDASLVLLKDDKKHTRQYVENPLMISNNLIRRLAMVTNIEENMFIGIAIVNDECDIDVNLKNNQHYIVKSKDFYKLIKTIESRPIESINQEQLQQVVKDLDKLNRKGKKYAKKHF